MISKVCFRLTKNGEPNYRCFCRHPELIENYEKAIADTTQTWECHHREEEFYSYKELVERGEYYDVPPEALIFLTHKEHCKVDSFCKRVGKALKGNKNAEGKLINRKDQSKKVLCVETGEIFESVAEVQRKTGIYHGNISKVCLGKLKTTGGYHWQFFEFPADCEITNPHTGKKQVDYIMLGLRMFLADSSPVNFDNLEAGYMNDPGLSLEEKDRVLGLINEARAKLAAK